MRYLALDITGYLLYYTTTIMYEIRYRESNSNGPYNMTNTTNTQYSIGGLLPNTNYTIGVRAYTSVGPGEWSDTQISTSKI